MTRRKYKSVCTTHHNVNVVGAHRDAPVTEDAPVTVDAPVNAPVNASVTVFDPKSKTSWEDRIPKGTLVHRQGYFDG